MRKSVKELQAKIDYRLDSLKHRLDTDEGVISDHSFKIAELKERVKEQRLILDSLMGYLKVKAYEEEELVSDPPNSYIKRVWKIKKSNK